MRFSAIAAGFALVGSVVAEDLLFLDELVGDEEEHAVGLGFTTKVVTETEWRAMKTSDFAAFKAIIIGDPFGSSDVSLIQVLADTNTTWGPAVTGNVIIHGADQSNHDSQGVAGASVLIDNSIKFAAAGVSSTGSSQTGFYLSLSQYYNTAAVDTPVPALSYFGDFKVFGQDNNGAGGYNEIHIVASSPAIDTLTDADLSNWSYSTHEAFSSYPSVGQNGFQALAIADGVITTGTQSYGDGHSGLPYILSRGATPAGCGDGKFDPSLGEECDDGNTVDGDGCSKSCKCESGIANGDGTCGSANTTSSSTTSTTTSTSSSTTTTFTTSVLSTTISKTYTNTTTWSTGSSIVSSKTRTTASPVTATTSRRAWTAPPYITPSVPKSQCIGIEVIVSVTEVEQCSTIDPTSTVTYTTTSVLSTYQKPIYNTPIPSMPCYVCAFEAQGITVTDFITATTTHCPSKPTAEPAVIYPCATCQGTSLTASCPWKVTPTAPLQPYTTYGPAGHEHGEGHPPGAGHSATVAATAVTYGGAAGSSPPYVPGGAPAAYTPGAAPPPVPASTGGASPAGYVPGASPAAYTPGGYPPAFTPANTPVAAASTSYAVNAASVSGTPASSAWTPDAMSVVATYTGGAASRPTGAVGLMGVLLGAGAVAVVAV
ncbi:uncharacterized protein PV07_11812 [Cladophialophora immunda]|uniref:DUF4215 domain-containing protein n=1 Tax=Cladophialophora immunda TaxID=569365 RepID=A0A0D1Z7M6_9EURO|nr:uncharacterized protein PV07_11812 [Cladophialophora immunda]KIW23626.1 hypothetical protein PV07_11812 [Cladophialophora immunda]OQV05763.1 Myxococcu cysteine-rich repeat-containing protein [Cladophialophora immunda]